MNPLTFESAEAFRSWSDNDLTGLADRIKRTLLADEDYRLPNLHRSVPADMVPEHGSTVTVYRGVPRKVNNPVIRPGDWVTLSRDYAQFHGLLNDEASRVISMSVPAEDVIWAGTDMNEFFYAPSRLVRLEGEPMFEAVGRIGMGAFEGTGNQGLPDRGVPRSVIALVRSNFELEWQGIHGAAHWARVKRFGEFVGQDCGADLKVVRHFAFLHDICREDDHGDSRHGLRAAAFVHEARHQLDLSSSQLELLTTAIEYHSAGDISDDPTIGACWDADRLDLARLFIEPDPALMSTEKARQPETIAWAQRFSQKRRGVARPYRGC